MNRLKQLRNSRGITQDELGRMLGVQKAAICKYENGRVNMPNSVIMRLVEIFQVSADYLLGTDEVVPLLKSSSAKLSSSSMPHTPAIGVPLVGFVHAGLPMLADENITEYIPVSANKNTAGIVRSSFPHIVFFLPDHRIIPNTAHTKAGGKLYSSQPPI